jgi:hypothetical protein
MPGRSEEIEARQPEDADLEDLIGDRSTIASRSNPTMTVLRGQVPSPMPPSLDCSPGSLRRPRRGRSVGTVSP